MLDISFDCAGVFGVVFVAVVIVAYLCLFAGCFILLVRCSDIVVCCWMCAGCFVASFCFPVMVAYLCSHARGDRKWHFLQICFVSLRRTVVQGQRASITTQAELCTRSWRIA